jgi:hypothetical protein
MYRRNVHYSEQFIHRQPLPFHALQRFKRFSEGPVSLGTLRVGRYFLFNVARAVVSNTGTRAIRGSTTYEKHPRRRAQSEPCPHLCRDCHFRRAVAIAALPGREYRRT